MCRGALGKSLTLPGEVTVMAVEVERSELIGEFYRRKAVGTF